MKKRVVFERVYRMDAFHEFDWSQVCDRVLAPGQGPHPREHIEKALGDLHGLRVEYLLNVMNPLHYYSIDVARAGLDSEGLWPRAIRGVSLKDVQR